MFEVGGQERPGRFESGVTGLDHPLRGRQVSAGMLSGLAAVRPDQNPNAQLGERFCAMIEAVAPGTRSVGLIYPTEMPEDLPLVLLYRLLFVLYAESRTLLPVDNAVYRDSYSLEPLRDEIMQPNILYLPGAFRLWETMQALFRLIVTKHTPYGRVPSRCSARRTSCRKRASSSTHEGG